MLVVVVVFLYEGMRDGVVGVDGLLVVVGVGDAAGVVVAPAGGFVGLGVVAGVAAGVLEAGAAGVG